MSLVTAICLRLLTILALLAMPFGMPAAAAAAPAMQAGHCDSQHDEPSREPSQGAIHCVGCTALPVLTPQLSQPGPPRTQQLTHGRVVAFRGIELEIATPPPKGL